MHRYMRYSQLQYEYPVALELFLIFKALRCGGDAAYGGQKVSAISASMWLALKTHRKLIE